MPDLDVLALDLHVSGRTLRRAANRGTIHAIRESDRHIRLPHDEATYLRRNWRLLASLVAELRTLPDVRFAVLFGSAARGELKHGSDLDLLVRFARGGIASRSHLMDRLEQAAGRDVQVVVLDDALDAPLLLADILRDGRVLVDRDGEWTRLKRRERSIRREAETAEAQLADGVVARLRELGAWED